MRYRHLTIGLGILLLIGCAQTPTEQAEQRYGIKKSYLSGEQEELAQQPTLDSGPITQRESSFQLLNSLVGTAKNKNALQGLVARFSNQEKVTFAADAMPLDEFIHYAFGEALKVNYVIDNDVKNDKRAVTLNIQNQVGKAKLFEQVANVLQRYQVSIDYNNDLFYLSKSELGKAKAVIGIGRDIADVPSTSGSILQVIPLKYGVKISVERTVRELIDATVTADFEQGAFFVLGDRANVLRAIELVNLLDVPANRGRHIGLLSLKYIATQEFLDNAKVLMTNEGLPIGLGNEANRGVLLVPINHIGAVAVFASSEELLERVRYWASIMDKPSRGENQQYFVYNPKYARATDLGESIGSLLSLGTSSRRAQRNDRTTGANADALAATDEADSNNQVVSGEQVSYVVDERSNSIIFSTTGSRYQTLLPLLEKLDVLPRQVILEVTIAEVTLSGSFQYGVEFALRNSGSLNVSSLGAFNAGDTGGLLTSFVSSDYEAIASFFKDNSFVNLLSNPSILVRDGVAAQISVGTEIPILGGTTVDPVNGVTQDIQYRQTGVDVNVTPTVNAQGVVIMNIDQQISNEVDNTASAGIASPSIFRRSLSTEVVVQSGQTVILGGLISEDSTNARSQIPILGDLPIIGKVFSGQNQQKSKTELVMLVTPRVIESNEQWEKLIQEFQNGLDNINIVN